MSEPTDPTPKTLPTTPDEWKAFINEIFDTVDDQKAYVLADAFPNELAACKGHNEGVCEVADQLAALFRRYGFDPKKRNEG
jgi:hypothetical protein